MGVVETSHDFGVSDRHVAGLPWQPAPGGNYLEGFPLQAPSPGGTTPAGTQTSTGVSRSRCRDGHIAHIMAVLKAVMQFYIDTHKR